MENPIKDKKHTILLNASRSMTTRMIAKKEGRSMHQQMLRWIDEGVERWFTANIPKEE